jgi:hypothetical protein
MIKINVVTQGAPLINVGSVYKQGDDVVALEIDLYTKYCSIGATTGGNLPGLIIDSPECSAECEELPSTFIEFPEFAGWRVWCAAIGRYTLSVCLVSELQNKKTMKTLSTYITSAMVALTPVTVFASSNPHLSADNSGMFVWAFLGFCALIGVTQVVPAVLLILSQLICIIHSMLQELKKKLKHIFSVKI